MQIDAGTSDSEGIEEKVRKTREKVLREVTVKIGLERIDTWRELQWKCCWTVVRQAW